MQHSSILLSFLLFSSSALLGQETSQEDQIEALWDLVYVDADSSMELARQLRIRSIAEGSLDGLLNGTQIIAESHYMNNDLDSAYHYYDLAMIIAVQIGDRNEIAHTHNSLASISTDRGKREDAFRHFQASLKIREDDNDSLQICDVATRYANCLGDFDMPDKAMDLYLLGLGCCRATHDELLIGHAYNGMAILHKKQKNFDKALELLDSAMFYYTKLNEDFFMASNLNNRGVIKKQLGRFQEARTDYEQGLQVMETVGYRRGIMSFNQNLGILANIQNEPELALAHCNKALRISMEINIPLTQSEALNEISKALLKQGNLQAALDSITRAIQIAERIASLEKQHQAWESKSQIHEAQGYTAEALEAYRRYVALNDSMFKLEKTSEIDRLQTEYETELKEQTISHLEAEAELDAARRKWLIIGSSAIIISALLIVSGVVQRRRKDKVLHKAQMELKDEQNKRLAEQLEHKRRELTEKALHLAQKNELLHSLEEDVQALKFEQGENGISEIANKLRFEKHVDKNWEQFTMAFSETNSDFFRQLTQQHSALTKNELRLSALLTMNLGSKDLAAILHVSDEGVKKARYRLRKKLELKTEDSLEQYLCSI